MGNVLDLPPMTYNFYTASAQCTKISELNTQEYTYLFKVHIALAVNITITKLYSPIEGDKKCEMAKIIVREKRVSGSYKFAGQFCGIHSQISIFTENSECSIEIYNNPKFQLNKDIFFTVIDKQTFYTRTTKQAKKFAKSLENGNIHTCIAFEEKCFVTFRIRVQHFQQIRLRVSDLKKENCQVFDGPGEKSDIVTPTRISHKELLFWSSTFQILLAVVLGANIEIPKVEYDAQFAKESVQNIPIKHLTFSLPNRVLCKHAAFCILTVYSSGNQHINLTLSGFVSTGDLLVESCLYTGLAIYSRASGTVLKYSHTECVKNQEGWIHRGQCYNSLFRGPEYFVVNNITKYNHTFPTFGESRSFVFSSGAILLIFYYYKNYATLDLKVSVSATQCRGLIIDVCKIGKPRDFLASVQDDTGGRNRILHTLKLPWKEKCYVLVLTGTTYCPCTFDPHLSFEQTFDTCSVVLRLNKVFQTGQTMHIQADGVLAHTSKVKIFKDFKLRGDKGCKGRFVNHSSTIKPCNCTANGAMQWNCHESVRCAFAFNHKIDSPISQDRHR